MVVRLLMQAASGGTADVKNTDGILFAVAVRVYEEEEEAVRQPAAAIDKLSDAPIEAV